MTQEKLTKSELESRKDKRRKAIEAERAKEAQAMQDQLTKSNKRRQEEWKKVGPKLTERKNERRQKRMEITQKVIEIGRRKKSPPKQDDIEALRTWAESAGVEVDKRWGADRLKSEIAAKEQA